ncbi:MAG: phosphoenolpyruvate carboxylase [Maricaulaceae bacterium]
MRRLTHEALTDFLNTQLEDHLSLTSQDPQTNPIKLLAYDISRKVEDREIAFRDIEKFVKHTSDTAALERAERLGQRAGIDKYSNDLDDIVNLAKLRAKDGFDSFKSWIESAGQGIVLTAHPTFSLSRDIRECLGQIATHPDSDTSAHEDRLKTLPYLPKRAPTLQEEHEDAQAAIHRIQVAIQDVYTTVLDVAFEAFPDRWTELTPLLIHVYSWVGYDIDGRTDISWADAIRLRLQEKFQQLQRYFDTSETIAANNPNAQPESLTTLIEKLKDARVSAARDLALFNEDLNNPTNLVAAANNLTRASTRRFLNLDAATDLITAAVTDTSDKDTQIALVSLRGQMQALGLGTSRIHFRLNSRHVVSALKSVFEISGEATDSRTLLLRASKLTQDIEPQPVNFASLALEKSTAHQQMILTAQIHKYIDDTTPIRFLIAECEDSLIPLGMLYLARLYGVDKHMDISPLFETASALNNGGRIIEKMLSNDVYRDYINKRGVFAIQTGFSDAGRFMGQIPATLAIERLHSHFARAMDKFGMKNVTSLIFNTHGEGLGRGGHPGDMKDRVDYVMSPWAVRQFEKRDLHVCHETSFQGGDGYMWFQTPELAKASVASLILARDADRSDAEDDIFYTEKDFSWDVFRTLTAEQESLYDDPNYVALLGGLGQNMLIPTGSRAAKRAKSGAGTFNPRQLRAIPHNAILQQFGATANIFYGVGRAATIDPEKFETLLKTSARARSIFKLVQVTMERANLSILTGYGRLYDPGFWASRALSGNEPFLAERCLHIAQTLKPLPWVSQIINLTTRIRMDVFNSIKAFKSADPDASFKDIETLQILHALRLAVIMKMMIIATELPVASDDSTSQLNTLKRLQVMDIDSILADLKEQYPETREALEWTENLAEKTDQPVSMAGGHPHITEAVVKPLQRASDLVRQITVAITHHYDAFG